MMSKLTHIELFSGCGGLLDGFEQTGKYNTIAAVEWMRPQVNTLINRLKTKYNCKDADSRVLHFDIQRTDELFSGWFNDKDYGTSHGLDLLVEHKPIDVISGGPPCQAYSIAGRIRDNEGMKNDYRNFLFESYIKVVDRYRPKVIVFENVEGLLSAIPTGEKITDLIRKAFDDIGYEIIDDLRKFSLFNLSEFGIPQNRKRIIIIGVRRDIISIDYQAILRDFYITIAEQMKEPMKTVYDAIADLPAIYPLKELSKRQAYENGSLINGHSVRFHNKRDQEIFYELAKDIQDGNNTYSNATALIKLYHQKTGKNTKVHKYHVLKWQEPSNTIPAHLKKDGLRHIHPDPNQKRSITVREAARLQTFDDDFLFTESQSDNFEMIGNAVPPLFAKKIASLIPMLIDKIHSIEKI